MSDLAAAKNDIIALCQHLGYNPDMVQGLTVTREIVTVNYRSGLGMVTGLGTDLFGYDIKTAVFPMNLG